jgi:hypothetical protein
MKKTTVMPHTRIRQTERNISDSEMWDTLNKGTRSLLYKDSMVYQYEHGDCVVITKQSKGKKRIVVTTYRKVPQRSLEEVAAYMRHKQNSVV